MLYSQVVNYPGEVITIFDAEIKAIIDELFEEEQPLDGLRVGLSDHCLCCQCVCRETVEHVEGSQSLPQRT